MRDFNVMKRVVGVVLVIVVAAAAAQPAVAATLVDFRVDVNSTATSPTGNWNVIDDPSDGVTVYSLVDFNTGNTSAGITLQFTDPLADSTGTTSVSGAWSNAAFPWINTQKEALNDYAWGKTAGDATGQITIAGLDNSKLYKLELLASHALGTGGQASYLLNGSVLADASIPATPSSAWAAYADGYAASGCMVWSSVAPSSGSFTVDASIPSGNTTDRIRVSGLRVSEIPEPGTLALLAIGAVALLLVRRCRRATD